MSITRFHRGDTASDREPDLANMDPVAGVSARRLADAKSGL
jgi:hypothetical protein